MCGLLLQGSEAVAKILRAIVNPQPSTQSGAPLPPVLNSFHTLDPVHCGAGHVHPSLTANSLSPRSALWTGRSTSAACRNAALPPLHQSSHLHA